MFEWQNVKLVLKVRGRKAKDRSVIDPGMLYIEYIFFMKVFVTVLKSLLTDYRWRIRHNLKAVKQYGLKKAISDQLFKSRIKCWHHFSPFDHCLCFSEVLYLLCITVCSLSSSWTRFSRHLSNLRFIVYTVFCNFQVFLFTCAFFFRKYPTGHFGKPSCYR